MPQTINAWLEDLRHAAHDTPNVIFTHHWQQLCARLEHAPTPEAARLGVDYLRGHLPRWPAGALTAQWGWIDALHKGTAHPGLSLCNVVYTPDSLSPRGLLTLLDRLHTHATSLHRLDVNLPKDLHAPLATRLAEHPLLTQTRELTFNLNAKTTPGALNALLAQGRWPNLERLTLRPHYQTRRALSIKRLADNPHSANLRRLTLHGSSGHDIKLAGAFDASNMPKLDALILHRSTKASLGALYDSPLLDQLGALWITGNVLPADAFAPLHRAGRAPLPLRSLTASPRDPRVTGAHLLRSPALPHLESLNLNYSSMETHALHTHMLGLADIPLQRRLLCFAGINVILTHITTPPRVTFQAISEALAHPTNPGVRLGAAYLMSMWFHYPNTRPADFAPQLDDPAPLLDALRWPGLDPDDCVWEYITTATGYTQHRVHHRVHAAAAHALAMRDQRDPDVFPQLADRFRHGRDVKALQAICHALLRNAPNGRAALDLFMHSSTAHDQAFNLALTALTQDEDRGVHGDLLALLRRGLCHDMPAACDLLKTLRPAPEKVLDDLRAAWRLHLSNDRASRHRRHSLVHAIAALDWSARLPDLADLFFGGDPHPCVNVELWSAHTLAAQFRHQPDADPTPLVRLVTDHKHPQVRLDALDGLIYAHLRKPGVSDAITTLVETPPARWNDLGAMALFKLARARLDAPDLCCVLAERALQFAAPDATLRANAMRQNAALKLLGTQLDALDERARDRARALARAYLASPELHVRRRAHVLAGFRPGQARPKLGPGEPELHFNDALSALDDANKGIRHLALQRIDRLLHSVPATRVIPALRAHLGHADARVRKRARRMLRRLGETVETPEGP